jgi:hypothetical protein
VEEEPGPRGLGRVGQEVVEGGQRRPPRRGGGPPPRGDPPPQGPPGEDDPGGHEEGQDGQGREGPHEEGAAHRAGIRLADKPARPLSRAGRPALSPRGFFARKDTARAPALPPARRPAPPC